MADKPDLDTPEDLDDVRFAEGTTGRRVAAAKRGKRVCRNKGSLNKKTIQKIQQAEREAAGYVAKRRTTLAVDHMDEMIDFLHGLVAKLVPWHPDGTPNGRDHAMWFRALDAFQGFLNMRAPYQSPRLGAVAIIPSPTRQKTVVNVTSLNEKGEKIFSDPPPVSEDVKQIEHEPSEPNEAA